MMVFKLVRSVLTLAILCVDCFAQIQTVAIEDYLNLGQGYTRKLIGEDGASELTLKTESDLLSATIVSPDGISTRTWRINTGNGLTVLGETYSDAKESYSESFKVGAKLLVDPVELGKTQTYSAAYSGDNTKIEWNGTEEGSATIAGEEVISINGRDYRALVLLWNSTSDEHGQGQLAGASSVSYDYSGKTVSRSTLWLIKCLGIVKITLDSRYTFTTDLRTPGAPLARQAGDETESGTFNLLELARPSEFHWAPSKDIGDFENCFNWQEGVIPGNGESVVLQNASNARNVLVMRHSDEVGTKSSWSFPADQAAYRSLIAGGGSWVLTNRWDPSVVYPNFNLQTETVVVEDNTSLSVGAGVLNSGRIDLGQNGTLSFLDGRVAATSLGLGQNSTLELINSELHVSTNLEFNANGTIRISLENSRNHDNSPILDIDGDFRAGGKLEFLLGAKYTPSAGDRFRLIRFKTNEKDTQTVYQNYRFKEYDSEIKGNPELIWGLVFRTIDAPPKSEHYIEVVVLEKPRLARTGAPVPGSSATGLVLCTHGTASFANEAKEATDVGFGTMAKWIDAFLVENHVASWEACAFDWSKYSTHIGDFSYNPATSAQIGIGLGESLHHWMIQAGILYSKMHLLSHSSGSWLVNRMAELFAGEQRTHVELTVFDAFTRPGDTCEDFWCGRFVAELGGRGQGVAFAEQYVDRSWASPVGTDAILPGLVNFDVTSGESDKESSAKNGLPYEGPQALLAVDNSVYLASLSLALPAFMVPAHSWPYKWYLDSIALARQGRLLGESYTCSGFALSPEFLESGALETERVQEIIAAKSALRAGDIVFIQGRDCYPLPPYNNDLKHEAQGKFFKTAEVSGGLSNVEGDGRGVSLSFYRDTALHARSAISSTTGDEYATTLKSLIAVPRPISSIRFRFQFGQGTNSLVIVYWDKRPLKLIAQESGSQEVLSSDDLFLEKAGEPGTHELAFRFVSIGDKKAQVRLSDVELGYAAGSFLVLSPGLSTAEWNLFGSNLSLGSTYAVEVSSDLKAWTRFTNGITLGETLNILVSSSRDHPRQFLRLREDLPPPPVIAVQPSGQNVLPGTDVRFTVNATGAAPLAFQWLRGGVPILGGTNADLLISSVTTNAMSVYTVVISNSGGSITSNPAELKIVAPPVILVQPISQTVSAGTNALFSVRISGSEPLALQWRFNGHDLQGETNASLVFTNVSVAQAGPYTVLVTNLVGSMLSSVASLAVTSPPAASMFRGIYSGYFGGNTADGGCVLFVRRDGSALLLAYSAAVEEGLYSEGLVIRKDGSFDRTTDQGLRFTGNLAGNTFAADLLAGPGSSARVSGARLSDDGPFASAAGFYSGRYDGLLSGQAYAILASDGTLFFYTTDVTGTGGGFGSLNGANQVRVVTAAGVSVSGNLLNSPYRIAGSYSIPDFGGGTLSLNRVEALP